MYNPTRRTASVAAFTLSAVVTLSILGAIQQLATQPAADAMLAKQGQMQIATTASGLRAKS